MAKPNSAEQKRYAKKVEEASPNSKTFTNCLKAFVVGGLICDLGQLIQNTLLANGLSKDAAGMYASVGLIFLAVALTGAGWFEKLGKFAGAGSSIPVTGFANAVAAPAIEFKKEGYVLGVGAKMFVVAGPVIVYGVLTSVVVGSVYYFMK